MNSTNKPFAALIALPKGALTAYEVPEGTLLVENDATGNLRKSWSDKTTCGEWTNENPYGHITCLTLHPDGKQIIAGTSFGYVGIVTLESGLHTMFKKELTFSFHYSTTHQVPYRSAATRAPWMKAATEEDRGVAALAFTQHQNQTVVAVTGRNKQTITVSLEEIEAEKLRSTCRPESAAHKFLRSVTTLAKVPTLATAR